MDTKWKILDGKSFGGIYGLSQPDVYQMFAYGEKYLQRKGVLILLYPRRSSFREDSDLFEFSAELSLRLVPFDLEYDRPIFVFGF